MFGKFGLYSDLMPKLRFKPDKGVLHRQTCPVCKRQLVNLYKQDNEWKCHQCWEEAKITINEAIKIIDPETSKEVLLPYAYNYQRLKVVDEACQIAAYELCKRPWISVKDRLPSTCQTVLVALTGISKRTGIGLAYIDNNGQWLWTKSGQYLPYNIFVTHWQPLPEPPKEG